MGKSDSSAFVIRKGILTEYRGDEKNVTVPDGVVEIEDRAFEYCELESVKLPESLKAIDPGAFLDIDKMQQVFLPSHLEFVGAESFDVEIKEMHYPGDFASWLALDKSNWLSSPILAAEEFYCNGERITEYSIPEGTERIEKEAFLECHVLEKILIPASVTAIGDEAFAYCDSLEEITIPASVREIGKKVFRGCESLKKAVVPEALREMIQENSVFDECDALTDIQYV